MTHEEYKKNGCPDCKCKEVYVLVQNGPSKESVVKCSGCGKTHVLKN